MENTKIVFFLQQLDYINKKPKHGRSEQRAPEWQVFEIISYRDVWVYIVIGIYSNPKILGNF